MNKKLIAALMMSMFLIGCSGSEETTNTDTIEVVESNEIVEKVESSIIESEETEEKLIEEKLVEEKPAEVKSVKKKPAVVKSSLFEKRTENIEMHIYGAEVPWGEPKMDLPEDSYTSIAVALNNAIAGDTIIVHEGVYREALNIKFDNITIKNFEDDYVLVTGTELVTGWQPALDHPTPGVMVAPVNERWAKATTDFTQVFVNGKMGEMGRHPNRTLDSMMMPTIEGGGYDEVSSIYKNANEPGNVTFNNGLPDLDLVGGLFRGLIGKAREYAIGHVVAKEGDKIQFEAVSKNNWSNEASIVAESYHKFGFGTIMHKNLIDVPGEWFLEDNLLYYLPEDGQEMTDLIVEMQVREKVLLINNADNVLIEGINFKAGNASIKNMNDSKIIDCSLRYLHPFWLTTGYAQGSVNPTGIWVENSDGNIFEDTYIAHTWGTGLVLISGQGNTVKNCIIEDIGWLGAFSSGIYTEADETRIEDCTFRDNGRSQVRVRAHGKKTDIVHNEFVGAMRMTEDSGAIAAESTGWVGPLNMKGSEIAYNKIHDVQGLPVSSGAYVRQFMLGLYLEDTDDYTAHHNLIYDIRADNYETDLPLERFGGMLYMGPRYNAMHDPVNFYNNTAWNIEKVINVWNIEIANHEELLAEGLKQKDATGLMSDGHFANNIIQTGICDLSYMAQNITHTGGRISGATVEGGPKGLITNDLTEFFEHAATVGCQFNPENNYTFGLETATEHFVDVANGDFALNENSPAYQGGVVIEGITSSINPDAGALEGGGYVLTAGSTLEIPEFKEIR
ncbi:MAG: hypothetical protein ATN31_11135 [Candidatus Epulonipiscioides saccharophilum]|nr:MAG: hypothetical protein ATN31_11135 [Epulopiscium sp. AS2M-Bin001]